MITSTIRRSSVWDASEIARYLETADIPVRLACHDSAGRPLVCSLWFLLDDGALWCATQDSAAVTRMIRADASCAFEVAGDLMPYRGVRGQGTAHILPEKGADVLQRLIRKYLEDPDSGFARWLISRAQSEVAIRIEPDWVTSWDFSNRMPG